MTDKGERTRTAILDAGLVLWRTGEVNVSARAIGEKLGLTHAGVLYYGKSTARLKSMIAEHAVQINDPVVIPMLITGNHSAVAHMDPATRHGWLSLSIDGYC